MELELHHCVSRSSEGSKYFHMMLSILKEKFFIATEGSYI